MYDSNKSSESTTVEDKPVENHVEKPLVDTVVEGIEGTDEPMEEKHPSVPAVLTMGVYPILLILALVAGLIVLYLTK